MFITLIPDPCKVYFVRYLNDDGTLRSYEERQRDLGYVCEAQDKSKTAGDPRSGEAVLPLD